MAGTVKYDMRNDTWFFNGVERRHDGAASIVVKRLDLVSATATDLVREMRRARRLELEPEFIFIDTAPDDYYSPKDTIVESISFLLGQNDELLVEFGFEGSDHKLDDRQLRAAVDPIVEPLLRRNKAVIRSVRAGPNDYSGPKYHTIELAVETRGRTLSEIYAIAESAQTLLHAAESGVLTRDNARDLLVGGRADLLVGLPESNWLDVKSQHYNLDTDQGKISLAEAVSRFCNAEDGGIVVVGMDTKNIAGSGETIKSLRPVPLDSRMRRRYRQAVENRVVPFPTGLDIDIIETSPGQGLVVLTVPPQDEELKPFGSAARTGDSFGHAA
jgi:hypothetical protein